MVCIMWWLCIMWNALHHVITLHHVMALYHVKGSTSCDGSTSCNGSTSYERLYIMRWLYIMWWLCIIWAYKRISASARRRIEDISKHLRVPRDQYIIDITSIHIRFENCPQKKLRKKKKSIISKLRSSAHEVKKPYFTRFTLADLTHFHLFLGFPLKMNLWNQEF